MSVLTTDPMAPATPLRTRQPAPSALHPPPITAPAAWDPVAFSAAATASEEQPRTSPRPRLVWSNGRARSLPDPQTWAGTVARACVETLRGTRPVTQLHRWLDPEVFTALSHRASLAARVRTRPPRGGAVRVRRVRPCRIAPGVWEAAVVLVEGRRVRAAAVRIEEHRGHWRTTAVQIA
ncbi:Rv3235 family protein [Ruania albidiflava]|uniref:Rv3235 family protein n=1 Tax=Ruania albidiflava TaxID=366586 RepID=UPI0003B6511F|nr:Rv3235 family protein [Ruania albidiflava]